MLFLKQVSDKKLNLEGRKDKENGRNTEAGDEMQGTMQ